MPARILPLVAAVFASVPNPGLDAGPESIITLDRVAVIRRAKPGDELEIEMEAGPVGQPMKVILLDSSPWPFIIVRHLGLSVPMDGWLDIQSVRTVRSGSFRCADALPRR
jgi:hypothetical protein